jgi:arabinose-5-phosphate isomerase
MANQWPVEVLTLARSVLRAEASAVEALAERLDHSFVEAVATMRFCSGRVILTGVGKSGHIARKVAATLTSTGTPAYFMHAGEASHGDLGMLRTEDMVVALSNSGETPELLAIVAPLKAQKISLVVVTGNTASTLAREADVVLDASVTREAGSPFIAPTSSTTAALALCDALALSLVQLRGFSDADFVRTHPGGARHYSESGRALDG